MKQFLQIAIWKTGPNFHFEEFIIDFSRFPQIVL